MIGQARKGRAGFTFIEIVLVAIIILILTGLTPPLFRKSFSVTQLKTSAQDLVQLMRYAQAKAVAERSVLRINFDLVKPCFWISAQDETSPDEFKRLAGKWGKSFLLPQGASVTIQMGDSPGAYINFYPDGSADQAAVKIVGSTGQGFEITTQGIINYAEIKE